MDGQQTLAETAPGFTLKAHVGTKVYLIVAVFISHASKQRGQIETQFVVVHWVFHTRRISRIDPSRKGNKPLIGGRISIESRVLRRRASRGLPGDPDMEASGPALYD